MVLINKKQVVRRIEPTCGSEEDIANNENAEVKSTISSKNETNAFNDNFFQREEATSNQSTLGLDAIIIGAGIAGIGAFITLRKLGFNVLCIDKRRVLSKEAQNILLNKSDSVNPTVISKKRKIDLSSKIGKQSNVNLQRRINDLQNSTKLREQNIILETKVVKTEKKHSNSFLVFTSNHNNSKIYSCNCLIIATGNDEMQFPLPGWELDGVTTYTSSLEQQHNNSLKLKSRIAIAGKGLDIYSLARKLQSGGCKVSTVIDQNNTSDYFKYITLFMLQPVHYLSSMISILMIRLNKHTRIINNSKITKIEGKERITRIHTKTLKHDQNLNDQNTNENLEFTADALIYSDSFKPKNELASLVGARSSKETTFWDFDKIDVDNNFRTSVDNVYCVGGAALAMSETSSFNSGVIAALTYSEDAKPVATKSFNSKSVDILILQISRNLAIINKTEEISNIQQISDYLELSPETVIQICSGVKFKEFQAAAKDKQSFQHFLNNLYARCSENNCNRCQLAIKIACIQIINQFPNLDVSQQEISPISQCIPIEKITLEELANLDFA